MSMTPRAAYEGLLLDLHREMKGGRGEEPHADELRQQMAELWYRLTEEECALFDELSADLYVIEGKRVVEPLAPGETIESVMRELQMAFVTQESRRALALLRKLPTADSLTAYAQGRCWERLGFLRSAVCFYDFASKQQPKAIYEILALDALVRGGLVEEAVRRAQEIELRSPVQGSLLLEAASVLHRTAAKAAEPDRRAVYQRVVTMVERAWDDAATRPVTRAAGLVAAGFSYLHLGDKDKALLSFDRAVAAYPSEATLLPRGLALLDADQQARALRDFVRAAELGTRQDWPYLYAAKEALEDGRFVEAEKFCEAGLAHTRRSEARGRLFEWSAIAAAQLGRPPAEVIRRFDRALAELPLDEAVQGNSRKYTELVVAGAGTGAARRTMPQWTLEIKIDEAEARASLEDALPEAA